MPQRNFIAGIFLAGACVVAFLTPARAEQTLARHVGSVHAYSGKGSDFVLKRAGQTVPVRLLLPLEEGDEITTPKDGVLVIRYTDGSEDKVTQERPPFRVTAHGRPVALSDKALVVLERAGLWASKKQESMRPAVGRRDTDPLAWLIPGLSDGSARVVRGDRRLGLAWKGGKGPFRVTIKGADGRTLLDAKVKPSEVGTIEPRKLEPGQHDVILEAADGKRLEGRFIVVEAGAAPPAEAELQTWLAPGWAGAVAARSLAEQDRAWCYEAYLALIGAEKNDFPLAERLRQEICD
jgi:hypothetical protein